MITREPVQTQTVVTTAALQLTPVQRQTVYRTIVRERVQPAQPAANYRVGMHVPAMRSYKYMMVNNRVVPVDPATSEVVGELAD